MSFSKPTIHQEKIFKQVLDGCYTVHTALGPGLLESAYEKCLAYELQKKGLEVETQKPMPLVYEEVKMEVGYRVDLFVEKEVIVEVKAVEAITPVHWAQVLTYLHLANKKLGLLVNFHEKHLKNGVKRVIN